MFQNTLDAVSSASSSMAIDVDKRGYNDKPTVYQCDFDNWMYSSFGSHSPVKYARPSSAPPVVNTKNEHSNRTRRRIRLTDKPLFEHVNMDHSAKDKAPVFRIMSGSAWSRHNMPIQESAARLNASAEGRLYLASHHTTPCPTTTHSPRPASAPMNDGGHHRSKSSRSNSKKRYAPCKTPDECVDDTISCCHEMGEEDAQNPSAISLQELREIQHDLQKFDENLHQLQIQNSIDYEDPRPTLLEAIMDMIILRHSALFAAIQQVSGSDIRDAFQGTAPMGKMSSTQFQPFWMSVLNQDLDKEECKKLFRVIAKGWDRKIAYDDLMQALSVLAGPGVDQNTFWHHVYAVITHHQSKVSRGELETALALFEQQSSAAIAASVQMRDLKEHIHRALTSIQNGN
jgi:Ca2+-binding EF-hand superfamily protein